jgi:hypothetical protein
MFNCLTEQINKEERKTNKKFRNLSDEQRADIERQHAEELQIMRKQFEDYDRRKEEYKQKKIQERVERERLKENARKKENEQIRRQEQQKRVQEEQQRLRKAQEEQVRRAEENHHAEEKRRVEEEIRLEEKMRFEEAIRRTQAEKMHQLQYKQFIDNEINELQLKHPGQTHRTCVLKLCKKYHPDKNPTIDPEYIRILNSMK